MSKQRQRPRKEEDNLDVFDTALEDTRAAQLLGGAIGAVAGYALARRWPSKFARRMSAAGVAGLGMMVGDAAQRSHNREKKQMAKRK